MINFIDNGIKPKDKGIKIETSIKFKYKQLRNFLGRQIGVEPSHLKFYKPNPAVNKAVEELKPGFEGDIQELFERFDNRKPKNMYYDVLPVPLDELGSREKFTIQYIDNQYVEATTLTVFPAKGSNVKALLDEVKKDFDVEMGLRGGSKEFRMLDVSNHKIARIFENKTPISNLQPNKQYRVEEILAEEVSLPSNACLMQVIHFHRTAANAHGHPFFMRVEEGESFPSFLARLQDRNAITDVDFVLYKFAIVKGNKADYITPKDYPKIKIKDFKSHFDTFFGMDHAKKFRQRKRPVGIVKGPEDIKMKIG
jgi:ubiquitin carboxyl-terminal hydrolase 7